MYRDFIKNTSKFDDQVDVEKMLWLIPDSSILRSMNDDSFNEWRIKLFHTNITYFDRAIERAKAGQIGEMAIDM